VLGDLALELLAVEGVAVAAGTSSSVGGVELGRPNLWLARWHGV